MKGLRRKVMYVGDRFWPMPFGNGDRHYSVVRDGLPDDARAVACHHDGYRIGLVFESESFEVVAEGQVYPEIKPIFLNLQPPTSPVDGLTSDQARGTARDYASLTTAFQGISGPTPRGG